MSRCCCEEECLGEEELLRLCPVAAGVASGTKEAAVAVAVAATATREGGATSRAERRGGAQEDPAEGEREATEPAKSGEKDLLRVAAAGTCGGLCGCASTTMEPPIGPGCKGGREDGRGTVTGRGSTGKLPHANEFAAFVGDPGGKAGGASAGWGSREGDCGRELRPWAASWAFWAAQVAEALDTEEKVVPSLSRCGEKEGKATAVDDPLAGAKPAASTERLPPTIDRSSKLNPRSPTWAGGRACVGAWACR